MSKTWKWILGILGILVVLVVLSALVAAGFALQTRFGVVSAGVPFNGREFGPMHRGNEGWGQPMMQGNQHYQMMGGRGRGMPFGGGGLVGLVFFGLALYGAYWLGRRNARIALDPKPAARVDAVADPKTQS